MLLPLFKLGSGQTLLTNCLRAFLDNLSDVVADGKPFYFTLC